MLKYALLREDLRVHVEWLYSHHCNRTLTSEVYQSQSDSLKDYDRKVKFATLAGLTKRIWGLTHLKPLKQVST